MGRTSSEVQRKGPTSTHATIILSQISLPSKIAASRLQRLFPEMGGGPDPKPEHLLAILPFAEPTAVFDRIRKNHPNIKVSYHNLAFADVVWKGLKSVPKGEH